MLHLSSYKNFEFISPGEFEIQVENGTSSVLHLHQCLMEWYKLIHHPKSRNTSGIRSSHQTSSLLQTFFNWKKLSKLQHTDNHYLSLLFIRWYTNTQSKVYHTTHEMTQLKPKKPMQHSEVMILCDAFSQWKSEHSYQTQGLCDGKCMAEQPFTRVKMIHCLYIWVGYTDYKKCLKKSEKISKHVHNTNTCQYYFKIWLGVRKNTPISGAIIEPVLSTHNANLDCCIS